MDIPDKVREYLLRLEYPHLGDCPKRNPLAYALRGVGQGTDRSSECTCGADMFFAWIRGNA